MTEEQFNEFEKLIDKTETCHLFTGELNSRGFGTFIVDDKKELAHNAIMHHYGYEGKAFHNCSNKNCVNPEHLHIGSAEYKKEYKRTKK